MTIGTAKLCICRRQCWTMKRKNICKHRKQTISRSNVNNRKECLLNLYSHLFAWLIQSVLMPHKNIPLVQCNFPYLANETTTWNRNCRLSCVGLSNSTFRNEVALLCIHFGLLAINRLLKLIRLCDPNAVANQICGKFSAFRTFDPKWRRIDGIWQSTKSKWLEPRAVYI